MVVVTCILIQMDYLNKALDIFSINVVTPIYYVMFTTLVIVASAILFKEWRTMTELHIFGALFGFFTVVGAVILLNGQKDYEPVPLNKGFNHTYSSSYNAWHFQIWCLSLLFKIFVEAIIDICEIQFPNCFNYVYWEIPVTQFVIMIVNKYVNNVFIAFLAKYICNVVFNVKYSLIQ